MLLSTVHWQKYWYAALSLRYSIRKFSWNAGLLQISNNTNIPNADVGKQDAAAFNQDTLCAMKTPDFSCQEQTGNPVVLLYSDIMRGHINPSYAMLCYDIFIFHEFRVKWSLLKGPRYLVGSRIPTQTMLTTNPMRFQSQEGSWSATWSKKAPMSGRDISGARGNLLYGTFTSSPSLYKESYFVLVELSTKENIFPFHNLYTFSISSNKKFKSSLHSAPTMGLVQTQWKQNTWP